MVDIMNLNRFCRILGDGGCRSHLLNLCRRHMCRRLHDYTAGHVLTSSEALKALSPFYLAVHPDLFSRFPREKAVNEDSLKRLNSYLDSLDGQNQKLPEPICLTFFIHPKFASVKVPNTVKISLSALSVGSAIHDILESCDLSVHINSTTRAKLAKIKTSDQLRNYILSTYTQYHSVNPHPNVMSDEDLLHPDFEAMLQKRSHKQNKEPTNILQWLESNIKVSVANSESSFLVRSENQVLVEEICQQCQVKDVKTDVEWTATTLRGHLQSVKELCQNTQVESVLEEYGGDVTLCLGYRSFVDVNSCVHLNCEQTLQQWIQFFQHVQRELEALRRVIVLEKKLERYLSAKKLERPTSVSPQEYEVLLATYLKQHLNNNSANEGSHGTTATLMLLPCDVCEGPFIAENGTVVFSLSCSVSQLLSFTRFSEVEIRERREKHKHSVIELNQAREESQKALKLLSLTWKPTITDTQALTGCHQLLKLSDKLVIKDPTHRAIDLEGHYMCLCTHRAISSDGVIKIPWNFVLP